jgi:N-carbamoyl-L-amino-acid hydrolase
MDAVVDAVVKRATERAGRDGTEVAVTAESISAEVTFDTGARRPARRDAGRRADPADRRGPRRGRAVGEGADRDAVRAQPDRDLALAGRARRAEDCAAGVDALATVLRELT